MDTDICTCKATRGDHEALAARIAAAMKNGGKDPIGRDKVVTLDVSACEDFQLDRKATWAAEKKAGPRRRTCLLLTGCTTCGDRGSVTYHKDAAGNYRHTGCPGPKGELPPATAAVKAMDKSKTEAPR